MPSCCALPSSPSPRVSSLHRMRCVLCLTHTDSMNLNAVCAGVAPRRSEGYSFAGEMDCALKM